jgi:hypothetical protein
MQIGLPVGHCDADREVSSTTKQPASRGERTGSQGRAEIASVADAMGDKFPYQALDELRTLIADNDATALEKCECLQGRVPPGMQEALKAAQDALSGFDFQAAQEAIARV